MSFALNSEELHFAWPQIDVEPLQAVGLEFRLAMNRAAVDCNGAPSSFKRTADFDGVFTVGQFETD